MNQVRFVNLTGKDLRLIMSNKVLDLKKTKDIVYMLGGEILNKDTVFDKNYSIGIFNIEKVNNVVKLPKEENNNIIYIVNNDVLHCIENRNDMVSVCDPVCNKNWELLGYSNLYRLVRKN